MKRRADRRKSDTMAGFSVPPLSGRARRRSESVRPELPGFGLDDNNDDAGGWEDDHDDNGMQMDDNAASGPGSTQQAVLDRLMGASVAKLALFPLN